MTKDMETMFSLVLFNVALAALSTTLVPLLYSFTKWNDSRLGWAFMLQGVAFALAIDLTLTLHLWTPSNMMLLLWINVVVFTFIAASTSFVAWTIWHLNYKSRKKRKKRDHHAG